MKKILLVFLFVSLIFTLGQGEILADEPAEIQLNDTRVVAGGNIATFRDTDFGFNIYGGLGLPFSDELLMVAQYERYIADDLGMNGITADFIYELARVVSDDFDLLRFYARGSLGYYFGSFEDQSLSSMGIKAGVGGDAELFAGFGVGANVSFRSLEFEEEGVDLSGIEAGINLFYSFDF